MTDKRPETEEEFEAVLAENDDLVKRFCSGDIHALASQMEATGAKVTSTKVTEPCPLEPSQAWLGCEPR